MAQHIGIVACSGEGAALCYQTICLEGSERMGPHNHPEVSLHNHPLAEYMKFITRDDWAGVAELMMSSAEKLARTGADFLICPDNTIHQGFHRVGVLGTKYLMEGPVYPERLQAAGLLHGTPSAPERERINQIIFDELVCGKFLPQSLAYFTEVIRRLKDEACDVVALACTEIPLLVPAEVSPLPVLDSTRLLARAALRKAIED